MAGTAPPPKRGISPLGPAPSPPPPPPRKLSDGGEGGGEAAAEGGDDKTKLLEGDGSPGKEAKEKGKKEKGGKNKLSFEERKAAGKKNQLAKAQAKEDKHAAKLETAPTPLTRTRTLTLTPTIDPDPKPSPDPTRETLPSDH